MLPKGQKRSAQHISSINLSLIDDSLIINCNTATNDALSRMEREELHCITVTSRSVELLLCIADLAR